MRHNNNGRRFRGRNNNNGGNSNSHYNNSGGNNGGGRRPTNPRVQSFDSNGPDVRIRGNAFQINEKYLALARDAMSAGDRVQAESYLQHAEHYQRLINEMSEEYSRNNPQPQQQPHQQPVMTGDEPQPDVQEQKSAVATAKDESLEDLDQSFLRPRDSDFSGKEKVKEKVKEAETV